MNQVVKKEILDATVIKLCAMIVAIQNVITHFDTADANIPTNSEIIPIKEALSMLHVPETAIQLHADDGTLQPIDWASLPIGIPKESLSLLTSVDVG